MRFHKEILEGLFMETAQISGSQGHSFHSLVDHKEYGEEEPTQSKDLLKHLRRAREEIKADAQQIRESSLPSQDEETAPQPSRKSNYRIIGWTSYGIAAVSTSTFGIGMGLWGAGIALNREELNIAGGAIMSAVGGISIIVSALALSRLGTVALRSEVNNVE
jgi:hypothetical protein